MKNLLFITGHRHVDEIGYYSKFLQRNKKLCEQFDIFVHVNSIDNLLKITEHFNSFPVTNKTIQITTKNSGFTFGLFEGLSDNFNIFKEYDNVIHTHPDVYTVNEQSILNLIEQHTDSVFLVNQAYPTVRDWMSTDLFVFRPKLLKENIFKNWSNAVGVFRPNGAGQGGSMACAEQFLYDQVTQNEISHEYITRFHDDNYYPRRICNWGFWHEHDLMLVDKYLNNN